MSDVKNLSRATPPTSILNVIKSSLFRLIEVITVYVFNFFKNYSNFVLMYGVEANDVTFISGW